ncbi:hypothetical protein WISP_102609 [Willisornis vidua]|uniref:Uncharacterized protein n=1 Tax=Willisornis vidua TaxID=1566151 RepID=A0ABQ9D438_9PASS|nr:hypothetical protein WISP_102609 [Willisornis vidua]
MATRSCREKAQKQNEQHQAILAKLLREEDNKYCADCEAKAFTAEHGVEWMSLWSVWGLLSQPCLLLASCPSPASSLAGQSEEQVQDGPLGTLVFLSASDVLEYIEILGSIYQGSSLSTWINGHQSKYRAAFCNLRLSWKAFGSQRTVYDKLLIRGITCANQRPAASRAVEFFIRDKYEKKKYYDKNAINAFNISSSDAAQPLASSPSLQAAAEKSKAEKEKEKKKEEKKRERESEKPSKQLTVEKPQKKEDQQSEAKASPKKSAEPTIDLLGLDGPAEASVTNGGPAAVTALNDDLDIFGPMISNPLPAAAVPPAQISESKSFIPPNWVRAILNMDTGWAVSGFESSPRGKELGVLVDENLGMSWQMRICSPEMRICIKSKLLANENLHQKQRDQQVEGEETSPAVLSPAFGSSAKEGHGSIGAGPEQGDEDDQRDGAALLGGQAERIEAVQPGEEKRLQGHLIVTFQYFKEARGKMESDGTLYQSI